jgi:hypothetical protein
MIHLYFELLKLFNDRQNITILYHSKTWQPKNLHTRQNTIIDISDSGGSVFVFKCSQIQYGGPGAVPQFSP